MHPRAATALGGDNRICIVWDQSLATALSYADLAIMRIAGEGSRLPNPHLLIRPFVCREAFLSSRIEGTQANLAIADSDTAVRLPAELGNLTNLEELYVGENQLSGCIPEGLRGVPYGDYFVLGLPFCGAAVTPAGVATDREALVALYNVRSPRPWSSSATAASKTAVQGSATPGASAADR